MLLVASFFDLISLIPFVNIISSVIAWMIFTVWFYFLGAGLLNTKKLATVSLSFLAELIPFVSMLPLITTGVFILIFMQNNPVLGKLAHKGLDIKKQSLNKKIQGFESNKSQLLPSDTKKIEGGKQITNSNKQSLETKTETTPSPTTTTDKRLENQIPQRRFIRDIDPPAPYGEEDQDEFNIAA